MIRLTAAAASWESLHGTLGVEAALVALVVVLGALGGRMPLRAPQVVGAATVATVVWTTRPGTIASLLLVLLVAVSVVVDLGQAQRWAWSVAGAAVVGLAVEAPRVEGHRAWGVLLVLPVAVAASLPALERRWSADLVLVQLGVAVVGAWATLPDTEAPLGVGVGLLVVLAARCARGRLGREGGGGPAAAPTAVGWIPAMAAWAWMVLEGGRGRATGVLGAVGCLGLLAVLPAVGRVLPRAPSDDRGSVAISLVLLQVASVAVAARVAGLRARPVEAVLVVAVDLLVTAAVAATVVVVARGRRTTTGGVSPPAP